MRPGANVRMNGKSVRGLAPPPTAPHRAQTTARCLPATLLFKESKHEPRNISMFCLLVAPQLNDGPQVPSPVGQVHQSAKPSHSELPWMFHASFLSRHRYPQITKYLRRYSHTKDKVLDKDKGKQDIRGYRSFRKKK